MIFLIIILGGLYHFIIRMNFCNCHKMDPYAVGKWKGGYMKPYIYLKYEYFGNSLSGALIINLWSLFDYYFDYHLFVY